MPMHLVGASGVSLFFGRDWRAGLLAGLAALATVLGARFLGLRKPQKAAESLGLAAGFSVLANPFFVLHGLPERLPLLALLAQISAWLLGCYRFKRARRFAAVLALSLLASWWLCGAPLRIGAVLAAWPMVAIIAVWSAALAALLVDTNAWCVAASSLSLAGALHAVGAPGVWELLALIPAGATLGAIAAPAQPLAHLASALSLGGVAGGAVVFAGRLRHGALNPVDFAAFAPLLTAWVAGRLTNRPFRRFGRIGKVGGAVFALLFVGFLVYSIAALAGLR
jgi:hypothetical protein